MSTFENVTVVKEANVYFDGKVISYAVHFPDGSKKTLGVMLPGHYAFTTSRKEIMEITSGKLDVLLPDAADWECFSAGDIFEVPKDSAFKLEVQTITNYCCSYLD